MTPRDPESNNVASAPATTDAADRLRATARAAGVARWARRVRRDVVLAGLSVAALFLASCRTWLRPRPVAPSVTAEAAPKSGGVELYLESDEPGADVLQLPQSLVQIAVHAQPVLRTTDVASLEVVQVELGKAVEVKLTPTAARELERISAAAGRRRLVFVANHVPLGALRLNGPITDGVVSVFLEVPDAYLPRLLTTLKSEGVPVVGETP